VSPSARDVAAALRERLPGVATKKLHKLLYYAQGHHLAVFGGPLFDESISAWDMGPVVGSLWYEEKQGHLEADPSRLDECARNTVGYVVSRYGRLTGRDLENLSHAEDPWRRADTSRRPGESLRIEQAWIRDFFMSAASDDDEVVLDAAAVEAWLADAGDRRRRPARRDDVARLRSRLAGE
jgi:uncharacterized phage-associated protein